MTFGGYGHCTQTWNNEQPNFAPRVINAVTRDAHLANAAHAICRSPLAFTPARPPHCKTQQCNKQRTTGDIEETPNHALSIAGWGRLLNNMFGLTTLIAMVCIVVGGALARMTWWFWNEARPESPALAPLEIMSDAAYGKADEAQRVAMLDAVRMSAATLAPRMTVSRPRPTPEDPVDSAPRHVIDPLLK